MPIYEYRCQQCDHELEKLQRMSDAPLLDCPACRKPALKKLISAAAFRLKGSGWYETDFKKDGKRNLAGDKDANTSAAKSDNSKSDNKDAGGTSDNSKTSSNNKASDKPVAQSNNKGDSKASTSSAASATSA